MAKQKFDRCSECLMGSHILFNIVFATSALLYFELQNLNYPFTPPYLPIQASMAFSLFYYLLILSVILASSIHITSSSCCIYFGIMCESALTASVILTLIICRATQISLVFIYLALGAINGLTLLIIRKRMSLQSQNTLLFQKLLRSLVLSQFIIQELPDCCSICLDGFTRGQVVGLPCTPSNKHYFHLDCARLWFQSSHACPLCRGVNFLRRGGSLRPTRALVYPVPLS